MEKFFFENTNAAFTKIIEVLNTLREQCPWDKKQTIASLRNLTIEELYELIDAIDAQNWTNIEEEIGDVLLHLLFYAKIGEENGKISIVSVIEKLVTKLVHRHPHIYANTIVHSEDDVKKNWENLKLKEGKTSVLDGVPKALPAMVKAVRIQEKAKQVGFEWNDTTQVWAKIKEEIGEFEEHIATQNTAELQAEMGDIFFSLINLCRYINIDPEAALAQTNLKFVTRFKIMENEIKAAHQNMTDLNLEQMDEIWNKIKKTEKKL
jgi:XTP/dITP diphosphohydrolase